MKRFQWLRVILTLVMAGFLLSCSKPKLFGTLQPSDPVVHNYSVPPQDAFRAVKQALFLNGYSVKEADEAKMTLETYWQPATADSHYVLVFGERDYGTVGAYYRLVVKVSPRGTNGSQVSITNVAKSFISNIKSSDRREDAVLEKVDDFTRKKDINVTNIGLQ